MDATVAKKIAFSLYFGASVFTVIYCITLVISIKKAKNNALPATYIYNMAFGASFLVTCASLTYIVPYFMEDEQYYEYRASIGSVTTLLTTFSYIHPMFTLILMTINRIAVVLSMKASQFFTATKIWIYTFFHLLLNFTFLFIPYMSECRINFDQRKVAFLAACAPNRHPITTLFNQYSIFFPFVAFFFNLLIIVNFKLQRSPTYAKIKGIFKCGEKSEAFAQTVPQDVLKAKKKTERMLIIQSFVTAFYLAVYELTSLVLRVKPQLFAELSPDGKLAFTYFRMAQVPWHVFLVYFIFTPITRKIYLDFMKFKVFRMKPKTKVVVVSTTSIQK